MDLVLGCGMSDVWVFSGIWWLLQWLSWKMAQLFWNVGWVFPVTRIWWVWALGMWKAERLCEEWAVFFEICERWWTRLLELWPALLSSFLLLLLEQRYDIQIIAPTKWICFSQGWKWVGRIILYQIFSFLFLPFESFSS